VAAPKILPRDLLLCSCSVGIKEVGFVFETEARRKTRERLIIIYLFFYELLRNIFGAALVFF
jgi:hypothetical protein